MTNAEQNFRKFITKTFTGKDIPILSEDEKAILRHICLSRYNKIGRKLGGSLYLHCTNKCMIDSTFEDFFENVFEWINEGEEYEIKELLNDE